MAMKQTLIAAVQIVMHVQHVMMAFKMEMKLALTAVVRIVTLVILVARRHYLLITLSQVGMDGKMEVLTATDILAPDLGKAVIQ